MFVTPDIRRAVLLAVPCSAKHCKQIVQRKMRTSPLNGHSVRALLSAVFSATPSRLALSDVAPAPAGDADDDKTPSSSISTEQRINMLDPNSCKDGGLLVLFDYDRMYLSMASETVVRLLITITITRRYDLGRRR